MSVISDLYPRLPRIDKHMLPHCPQFVLTSWAKPCIQGQYQYTGTIRVNKDFGTLYLYINSTMHKNRCKCYYS